MFEESAIFEITALREGWLEAVRSGDSSRLASLVANDVVIVHGDGRRIRGKDEFEADFLRAFESFRIDQRVVDQEIRIRGNWAFEIAKVESTLTPTCGGACDHNDAGLSAQAAGWGVEGGAGNRAA
jgi:uncharacterized protein (TIGR02246 family)